MRLSMDRWRTAGLVSLTLLLAVLSGVRACSPGDCCEDSCFAAANPNPSTGQGYYAYNSGCLSGGLGCVGSSGCKLCRLSNSDSSSPYSVCPACVCQHYNLPSSQCAGGSATPPPSVPPNVPPPTDVPPPNNTPPSVPAGSHRVTLKNLCPSQIWAKALANSGSSPYASITTWALAPGSSVDAVVSNGWAGRFWGATGCTGADGTGCASGESGPATLAEFKFNGWNDLDFYDVSLVDGFNLPLTITVANPSGSSTCPSAGCVADLNKSCPSELAITKDGATVACQSACTKFGSPQYCCTGSYGCGAQCCPPTNYSQIFKAACPQAYSYAYDDYTSTFACPSSAAVSYGDFVVSFCLQ